MAKVRAHIGLQPGCQPSVFSKRGRCLRYPFGYTGEPGAEGVGDGSPLIPRNLER